MVKYTPPPNKAADDSETPRFIRLFRQNRIAVIGLALLVLTHLFAILGPLFTPHTYYATDVSRMFQTPDSAYLLGTDEIGRDVLTRLIYGARVSLLISWASVILAVLLGTGLGLMSGFFGGWMDAVIMRVTDAFIAVPTFFILLLTMAIFGPSIPTMVLVIAATSWMPIARVVRSDALRTRDLPFVEAAKASGSVPWHMLLKHVAPQAIPSVIVASTLGIAQALLTESALSYLGLGVQPPFPSLGNMLRNAQDYIWTSPSLAVYPGILIILVVLAYNWVGDGLRDAVDPRIKAK